MSNCPGASRLGRSTARHSELLEALDSAKSLDDAAGSRFLCLRRDTISSVFWFSSGPKGGSTAKENWEASSKGRGILPRLGISLRRVEAAMFLVRQECLTVTLA